MISYLIFIFLGRSSVAIFLDSAVLLALVRLTKYRKHGFVELYWRYENIADRLIATDLKFNYYANKL